MDEITCTSNLQTWNQPRKRRLVSKAANEISFKVESYLHTSCRKSRLFDPRPPQLHKTTANEFKTLFKSLKQFKIPWRFLGILIPQDNKSSEPPMIPRSVQ